MTFKLTPIAFALLLFSCTAGSSGKDAERKALNDESKKCIRAMNAFEEQKNSALQAGDATAAGIFQNSMDSAARENVMIGQKLMALDAEK